MSRKNWKKVQPSSLRHALELCKEYARDRRNLSVERIADLMGVADHFTLYKWLSTGRMPAVLLRAYETACGADFVTRWIAASAGKLIIDIPTGTNASAEDTHALQSTLHDAVGAVMAFYAGKASAEDALAAIQGGMESLAGHRVNIQKHGQPELDLGGSDE
jgi:hypothetical protein